MSETLEKIVVVGLGAMGLGMARSLRRAGLPVVGVDLRAERREALGDPVHASAQEAVEGADLLILVGQCRAGQPLFGPRLRRGPGSRPSSWSQHRAAQLCGTWERLRKGAANLDAHQRRQRRGRQHHDHGVGPGRFCQGRPALKPWSSLPFRRGGWQGLLNEVVNQVWRGQSPRPKLWPGAAGLDLQV